MLGRPTKHVNVSPNLCFPNHLFQRSLKPYRVPLTMFYSSIPQEENYWVNVDSVPHVKIEAYRKKTKGNVADTRTPRAAAEILAAVGVLGVLAV